MLVVLLLPQYILNVSVVWARSYQKGPSVNTYVTINRIIFSSLIRDGSQSLDLLIRVYVNAILYFILHMRTVYYLPTYL